MNNNNIFFSAVKKTIPHSSSSSSSGISQVFWDFIILFSNCLTWYDQTKPNLSKYSNSGCKGGRGQNPGKGETKNISKLSNQKQYPDHNNPFTLLSWSSSSYVIITINIVITITNTFAITIIITIVITRLLQAWVPPNPPVFLSTTNPCRGRTPFIMKIRWTWHNFFLS